MKENYGTRIGLLAVIILLASCSTVNGTPTRSMNLPVPTDTLLPIKEQTVVLSTPMKGLAVTGGSSTPASASSGISQKIEGITLTVSFVSLSSPKGQVSLNRNQKLVVVPPVFSNFDWAVNFDPQFLLLDPRVNSKKPLPDGWIWIPQSNGQTTITIAGSPTCWNVIPPCKMPGFDATVTINISP